MTAILAGQGPLFVVAASQVTRCCTFQLGTQHDKTNVICVLLATAGAVAAPTDSAESAPAESPLPTEPPPVPSAVKATPGAEPAPAARADSGSKWCQRHASCWIRARSKPSAHGADSGSQRRGCCSRCCQRHAWCWICARSKPSARSRLRFQAQRVLSTPRLVLNLRLQQALCPRSRLRFQAQSLLQQWCQRHAWAAPCRCPQRGPSRAGSAHEYGNDHSTTPKNRPAGRAAAPRGVAAARERLKWTWDLLTFFSTASQVLQEETSKSFAHLQCQEEAVLEWKAYVEHWLQLRVVKTTSSQREKKERAQKASAVKEKKRLQELEKLAVNVAKEKKTKLKKNNRSRKQERLRLRNSEDPAGKRKREDQLRKDRERKRKAYAKKKNELQELKQRHKDIEEGRNTLLKELSVKDTAYVGHLVAKLRLKGQDARRKLKIAFPPSKRWTSSKRNQRQKIPREKRKQDKKRKNPTRLGWCQWCQRAPKRRDPCKNCR